MIPLPGSINSPEKMALRNPSIGLRGIAILHFFLQVGCATLPRRGRSLGLSLLRSRMMSPETRPRHQVPVAGLCRRQQLLVGLIIA